VAGEKPTWTSSSFLVYTGGLTVTGGAVAALGYLAARNGHAAFAGWSLLVLVILYAIAHALKRNDRWLTAGIFAFASVVAWMVFVGALFAWWGWLHAVVHGSTPFAGFSVARLGLELLIIAAVVDDSRRFRLPFIVSIGVFVGWLFVTDLVSNGGTWSAVVTFLVGLVYLAIGWGSGRPSAFWFHLASGLLVGGALVYWWHASGANWPLTIVVALLYVLLARSTGRSSWAVLGAGALLAAAGHYADAWSHGSSAPSPSPIPIGGINPIPYVNAGDDWVPPLVFGVTGLVLVGLGVFVARGRRT
jgi:hypothetical protein